MNEAFLLTQAAQGHTDSYIGLAHLYYKQNRLNDCLEALSLAPQSNKSLILLVLTKMKQGWHGEAMEVIKRNMHSVQCVDTLLFFAQILQRNKHHRLTEIILRRILTSHPNNHKAMNAYFSLLLDCQRYQQAQEMLRLHGSHIDANKKEIYHILTMNINQTPHKVNHAIWEWMITHSYHQSLIKLLPLSLRNEIPPPHSEVFTNTPDEILRLCAILCSHIKSPLSAICIFNAYQNGLCHSDSFWNSVLRAECGCPESLFSYAEWMESVAIDHVFPMYLRVFAWNRQMKGYTQNIIQTMEAAILFLFSKIGEQSDVLKHEYYVYKQRINAPFSSTHGVFYIHELKKENNVISYRKCLHEAKKLIQNDPLNDEYISLKLGILLKLGMSEEFDQLWNDWNPTTIEWRVERSKILVQWSLSSLHCKISFHLSDYQQEIKRLEDWINIQKLYEYAYVLHAHERKYLFYQSVHFYRVEEFRQGFDCLIQCKQLVDQRIEKVGRLYPREDLLNEESKVNALLLQFQILLEGENALEMGNVNDGNILMEWSRIGILLHRCGLIVQAKKISPLVGSVRFPLMDKLLCTLHYYLLIHQWEQVNSLLPLVKDTYLKQYSDKLYLEELKLIRWIDSVHQSNAENMESFESIRHTIPKFLNKYQSVLEETFCKVIGQNTKDANLLKQIGIWFPESSKLYDLIKTSTEPPFIPKERLENEILFVNPDEMEELCFIHPYKSDYIKKKSIIKKNGSYFAKDLHTPFNECEKKRFQRYSSFLTWIGGHSVKEWSNERWYKRLHAPIDVNGMVLVHTRSEHDETTEPSHNSLMKRMNQTSDHSKQVSTEQTHQTDKQWKHDPNSSHQPKHRVLEQSEMSIHSSERRLHVSEVSIHHSEHLGLVQGKQIAETEWIPSEGAINDHFWTKYDRLLKIFVYILRGSNCHDIFQSPYECLDNNNYKHSNFSSFWHDLCLRFSSIRKRWMFVQKKEKYSIIDQLINMYDDIINNGFQTSFNLWLECQIGQRNELYEHWWKIPKRNQKKYILKGFYQSHPIDDDMIHWKTISDNCIKWMHTPNIVGGVSSFFLNILHDYCLIKQRHDLLSVLASGEIYLHETDTTTNHNKEELFSDNDTKGTIETNHTMHSNTPDHLEDIIIFRYYYGFSHIHFWIPILFQHIEELVHFNPIMMKDMIIWWKKHYIVLIYCIMELFNEILLSDDQIVCTMVKFFQILYLDEEMRNLPIVTKIMYNDVWKYSSQFTLDIITYWDDDKVAFQYLQELNSSQLSATRYLRMTKKNIFNVEKQNEYLRDIIAISFPDCSQRMNVCMDNCGNPFIQYVDGSRFLPVSEHSLMWKMRYVLHSVDQGKTNKVYRYLRIGGLLYLFFPGELVSISNALLQNKVGPKGKSLNAWLYSNGASYVTVKEYPIMKQTFYDDLTGLCQFLGQQVACDWYFGLDRTDLSSIWINSNDLSLVFMSQDKLNPIIQSSTRNISEKYKRPSRRKLPIRSESISQSQLIEFLQSEFNDWGLIIESILLSIPNGVEVFSSCVQSAWKELERFPMENLSQWETYVPKTFSKLQSNKEMNYKEDKTLMRIIQNHSVNPSS